MRFWCIAQPKYALDKLCVGSAQYGGRWNPVGMAALYCATSIALCSLEKFVHVGSAPMPPLVLVAVDLPEYASIVEAALESLPAGWDLTPASDAAQALGGAWLTQGTELAMKIPSAIVHEESNVMLNPRHPDFASVEMTVLRPFVFDDRMF